VTTLERNSYTEHDIRRGLTELALAAGNSRLASKRLEATHGAQVPHRTLHAWKTETHTALYEQLRTEILPKVNETIAAEADALALAYAQKEAEAIEGLTFDDVKPADRAAIVRNLATAKAINIDKSQLLRGKPTSITEHRDMTEALRALQLMGV